MMGVCLVVDDEPDVERLIRQRFRHEIRDQSLFFYFAQDGEQAIEVLRQHPDIELVLTDINMPRMDGLTLLQHVQNINPIARTIVISAYGDMGNIRTSMNRGAFDFIVKPIDFNDLRATMEKTLNYVHQIQKGVLSSRENSFLKMYVNPSIVAELGDKQDLGHEEPNNLLRSKRIEASVMFVDICGFTKLSETQSPETISTLLNSYFDEIAQITLRHAGTIDKFIGDAAMVVFEGLDHLARAVEAGVAIIKRINEIAGTVLTLEALNPHVSIGLNCGEMVSGNFGSASIRRLDYTVIGDTVNTASRLETIAGEGQIFISEEVRKKIPEHWSVREVGEIQLKNKAQATRVFAIITH